MFIKWIFLFFGLRKFSFTGYTEHIGGREVRETIFYLWSVSKLWPSIERYCRKTEKRNQICVMMCKISLNIFFQNTAILQVTKVILYEIRNALFLLLILDTTPHYVSRLSVVFWHVKVMSITLKNQLTTQFNNLCGLILCMWTHSFWDKRTNFKIC